MIGTAGRKKRRARLEAAAAKIRSDLPARAKDLRIHRAILFGSMARKTHDWSSDVDLIVVQETDQPFVRRGLDIIEALDLRVGLDLLVYSPEEWTHMKERRFIRQALEDGEVIYVADA